ncbi:hypothetical protein HAV_00160 [Candidatus Hepatincola sp. Av]
MKKLSMLFMLGLFFMLSSCGAFFNKHKPTEIQKDDHALEMAEKDGVIDAKFRYIVGDIIFIPVLFTGVVGLFYDLSKNTTYKIEDQDLYDAWIIKYKKDKEKQRQDLLNQANK